MCACKDRCVRVRVGVCVCVCVGLGKQSGADQGLNYSPVSTRPPAVITLN